MVKFIEGEQEQPNDDNDSDNVGFLTAIKRGFHKVW